jgi:uncharacterized membrane protein
MSLETTKLLGEVGALLMVLSPIGGSSNTALMILGLVLLLVAFKGLADHYLDQSIFKNVLWGIIILIVGTVIAGAVFSISVAGALTELGLQVSNWFDPGAWQGLDTTNLNYDAFAPYLAAIVGALVILFVSAVAAAYFIRKSLIEVAHKTGVTMFATSGLVLLIGAILTVFLIGFILLWIATLLLAIAFFEMKAEQPIQTATVSV